MSKYLIDSGTLTDIADAIRTKEESQNDILVSDFATRIETLPSGDDVGKYINLAPTDVSLSGAWWQYRMALPEIANLEIHLSSGSMSSMFNFCKWTYLPKIITDSELTFINMTSAFQQCSNVVSLDLSGVKGYVARLSSAFNACASLQHLDIRNLTFDSGTSFSSAFTSVPTDCEIIVKDDIQKAWFATNFSSLTNVKTVAEYEGE